MDTMDTHATTTADATKKTAANRCPTCNRKLALTDLTCRCGKRHCLAHRLPELHACSNDFRGDARKILVSQLERVVGEKLQKI